MYVYVCMCLWIWICVYSTQLLTPGHLVLFRKKGRNKRAGGRGGIKLFRKPAWVPFMFSLWNNKSKRMPGSTVRLSVSFPKTWLFTLFLWLLFCQQPRSRWLGRVLRLCSLSKHRLRLALSVRLSGSVPATEKENIARRSVMLDFFMDLPTVAPTSWY